MANRHPRVLVTRSPHQSSELADKLRALGLEPILIPTIDFAEPTSFAALDAALTHLDRFHWLLFTSANAVEAFHRRLPANPNAVILSEAKDPRIPPGGPFMPQSRRGMSGEQVPQPALSAVERVSILRRRIGSPQTLRIAAIGPSTARALETIGLTPDLIPLQAVAESLAEALLPHAHQPNGSPTRFLLIRAESVGDTPPREHLPETLRAAGAEVTVAPAYRTIIPAASIPALRSLFQPQTRVPPLRGGLVAAKRGIDAITFTSSSTVRNLLALAGAAGVTLPPQALRISIGSITSQTLRDAGYPPHAEAPEPTIPALAEAVLNALQQHPTA